MYPYNQNHWQSKIFQSIEVCLNNCHLFKTYNQSKFSWIYDIPSIYLFDQEIQFYYIILISLALVLILRILDKIMKTRKLLLAYLYCLLLFIIGVGGTIILFLILNYDTLALLYSCPSFAFDIIIIDPVRFIIYSNCLVKPVK